jgi:hypothetical protein
MDSPASDPIRPHPILILPEIESRRAEPITILVLAVGNRRCSAGGGYAGGARRVVSIAEHLARRQEVAAMVRPHPVSGQHREEGGRHFATGLPG